MTRTAEIIELDEAPLQLFDTGMTFEGRPIFIESRGDANLDQNTRAAFRRYLFGRVPVPPGE